ncbi:unnamed protein product, partial [marine sediment metagenome]
MTIVLLAMFAILPAAGTIFLNQHSSNLLKISGSSASVAIGIIGILTTISLTIMVYVSTLMLRKQDDPYPRHLLGNMHTLCSTAFGIGVFPLMSLIYLYALYAIEMQVDIPFKIVTAFYYS